MDMRGLSQHYAEVRRRLNSGTQPRENRYVDVIVADNDITYDWSKAQLSLLDGICDKWCLPRGEIVEPADVRANFVPRVELYVRLHRECGLSSDDVADLVGRDRSSIRRMIKRYGDTDCFIALLPKPRVRAADRSGSEKI